MKNTTVLLLSLQLVLLQLADYSSATELRGSPNIEGVDANEVSNSAPLEENPHFEDTVDSVDSDTLRPKGPDSQRRDLKIKIRDSCRDSHGGGNERHDVTRAYAYLQTLSHKLQHPPSWKLLAKTKTHASTVRYRIRHHLSDDGHFTISVNCQHTNQCEEGGAYAIALGFGRTRICYENMVRSDFTFCSLVGTIAHELGHSAMIPISGDGMVHNSGNTNDRVVRFGEYAHGLCTDELSSCEDYKLGKGPRITIISPTNGETADFTKWYADESIQVNGYRGFTADIQATAQIRGDYSSIYWVVSHPGGVIQRYGSANEVFNVGGTCNCNNEVTITATAEDYEGNTACDIVTFDWILGCDPDGTSHCVSALCPAGCL